MATGLGDTTQVLDGPAGIHVKGVASSTLTYQTLPLSNTLAGDGDIFGPEGELRLPSVGGPGFQLQRARLAAYGKINNSWGGYLHIEGHGDSVAWEGYLDAELTSGLRLRMGRWIQQTGPISGARLENTSFSNRTLGSTAFFGGELVETGLQFRYALPFDEVPLALSVAVLEGGNTISYDGGLGAEPEDLFSHMMYLVNFSAQVGALWDSNLIIGGFFGSGLNWTGLQKDPTTGFPVFDSDGNPVDLKHRTDIIGLNIVSTHQFEAYQIQEKLELILRNLSVPSALNAMDSITAEATITRDKWQLGFRVDALGAITPEPPSAFDEMTLRFSIAATYEVADQNYLRLQYNIRNDTPDREQANELILQGVFSLGGSVGGESSRANSQALKDRAAIEFKDLDSNLAMLPAPPETGADVPTAGNEDSNEKTISQAAAECQRVLDYIKTMNMK